MLHITVPPAIAKERDLVVAQALAWLQNFGYRDFHVQDYADHPPPDDVAIPVLNTVMTPDISATNGNGEALIANVEVSTDIGDSICGRRWQALLAWAQPSGTVFRVFVNERYAQRAREIAGEWHLDDRFIVALPSAH